MKSQLFAAVLLAFFGISNAANAETFAGGPAYAGTLAAGSTVACRIANQGNSALVISSRKILAANGTSLPFTGDNCSAPLGPAKSCAYWATTTGNEQYTCQMVVAGSDTRVTGIVEVLNANGFTSVLPLQRW